VLEAVSMPVFAYDGLVPVVDGLVEELVAEATTRLAALPQPMRKRSPLKSSWNGSERRPVLQPRL
jgi:hypothetical protein